MTLSAILLGLPAASSSPDPYFENCLGEFKGAYAGPVLALQTGDAFFMIASDCAVVASGTYDFHKLVRESWAYSPLEDRSGILKPVFISVEGTLLPSKKAQGTPVLQIRKASEVSADFSEADARKQFLLGANRILYPSEILKSARSAAPSAPPASAR